MWRAIAAERRFFDGGCSQSLHRRGARAAAVRHDMLELRFTPFQA
jgi:hypothetical protein